MDNENRGDREMGEEKQRHGCLTAWLVLMIVANAATAVLYLIAGAAFRQKLPNAPDWVLPVLIGMGVVNVVCAVGLFRWKKWGFYGFLVTSVMAFAVNLMLGLGIARALLGLVGVAILYGVLQIGTENKGWPQLE
jgi:hypothetical protein